MEEYIQKQRKRFHNLLSRATCLEPGTHEIEVAKVLGLGSYMVQPEVAIIEDTSGAILAIPEDRHCGDNLPRLVSRYDVVKGTKLKVVVARREITEVIILSK